MKRYDCLKVLAPLVSKDDLVVTNLGGVRVEWNAVRPSDANYNVFTLGLCSSVGLGLALAMPHRRVIVLDSDGSLLLNLPSLTTIADQSPGNLVHIVFDNKAYESAAGGRTHTANRADLARIAQGAGINNAVRADFLEDFQAAVEDALAGKELFFVVARVEIGTAAVAPDPYDALEVKYRFMRHLEKIEGKQLVTLRPPVPRKAAPYAVTAALPSSPDPIP
ncbi:MAG TPA: thiamine pyrophosphate-dependent enzyme [Acidimicrobiales bacterium]|nr:thiamine pyrophosphate-dependent enzyme [Acidimicrobiales bacterium]